jgi:hypothetical protein
MSWQQSSAASSAEALIASWLKAQRIPSDLADSYATSLVHLGYDDLQVYATACCSGLHRKIVKFVTLNPALHACLPCFVQSLAEDTTEEELVSAGIKPGHAKRISKQLESQNHSGGRVITTRSTAPLSSTSSHTDTSRAIIRCRRCQVICVDEHGQESTFWVEPGHEGDVQISTNTAVNNTATTHLLQQVSSIPSRTPVSVASAASSLAMTQSADSKVSSVSDDAVANIGNSMDRMRQVSSSSLNAALKQQQNKPKVFGNHMHIDSMESVAMLDSNALQHSLNTSNAVLESSGRSCDLGHNNSLHIAVGDPLEWDVHDVITWLQV